MTTLDSILKNFLNDPEGYVLIGSRAILPDEEIDQTTDYDVCVLRSNLQPDLTLKNCNINRYFTNVLPMGNAWLIPKARVLHDDDSPVVDILIFEDETDLNILAETTKAMSKYPLRLLKVKHHRVMLFEAELLDRGWLEQPEGLKE